MSVLPQQDQQQPAPQPAPQAGQIARQRRLRLLARADAARLQSVLQAWPALPAYRRLKPPETGLAMLCARAGGVGQRFNLGEMTVSRCVVVLENDGAMGVGYVQGRDQRKAEMVALCDALAQDAAGAERLETLLLSALEAELEAKQQAWASKVAATKVDFFTLVRGED